MNIAASKPLDPYALQQAKSLIHRITPFDKTADEYIAGGFFHWTADEWTSQDTEYNFTLPLVGTQWAIEIPNQPILNAIQVGDSAPYAAHTYERNSHHLGFAVEAMLGATSSDFGKFPIQEHQVELLCACAGAVARIFDFDCSDPKILMTHAEAAALDGYFGERWDFERLEPSPAPLSVERAIYTGGLLRARAHVYKAAIL